MRQIELELYERKKPTKFTNFNQNIELKNNSDLAKLYNLDLLKTKFISSSYQKGRVFL